MANEPERPIEKLLRAAAAKRRDAAGAAFELHPATRRLLQGEVARKFAKAQSETRSFAGVLGQWWPRLAWGAAIFAVLGVTVWVLLPAAHEDKSEALLARNDSLRQVAPTQEPPPPPPAPVAARPAMVAQANKMEAVSADRSAGMKPALAASPQVATQKETAPATITASGSAPAQAPAGAVNGDYQRQLGLAAKPVPPAEVPAAPAAPPPVAMTPAPATVAAVDNSAALADGRADQPAPAYKSLAAAAPANRPQAAPAPALGFATTAATDEAKSEHGITALYFAQVAPAQKAKAAAADKVPPAHPVLATFQVQQTGDELRIIDGDGSVYRGHLQVADATRRARSAAAETAAAPQSSRALKGVLEEKAGAGFDADRLALQTYSFRVTGTNRTLNQPVVFTGNLLAATNQTLSLPFTTNPTLGSGLGGGQKAPAQPGLQPLPNTRITGNVVIGKGKAIEINALPANR